MLFSRLSRVPASHRLAPALAAVAATCVAANESCAAAESEARPDLGPADGPEVGPEASWGIPMGLDATTVGVAGAVVAAVAGLAMLSISGSSSKGEGFGAAAAAAAMAKSSATSSKAARDAAAEKEAMSALRSKLRAANLEGTGSPQSLERLLHFYADGDRCLLGHLRATAVKGVLDPAAACDSIRETLRYRHEHGLDRDYQALVRDVEAASCRSYWPFAMAAPAPDGSPVEVLRLERLDVPRILSDFPEREVLHFFALWCELALRQLGDSLRHGAPTQGSLHVYDCRGVSLITLIRDARSHWGTVSRVFAAGQANFPDVASNYYVIYAPAAVSLLWKIIKPLSSEHTQKKVSFCRGVPPELVEALASEAAVDSALNCSPHVGPKNERA